MRYRSRSIAIRLSMAQVRLIQSLSSEPEILGCAEVAAKRLTKPTASGSRPALVRQVRHADGGSLFALTDAGLAVQAELEDLLS